MAENAKTSVISVTLNPAIDRTFEVPGFQLGAHQRGRLLSIQPGGKGVNVARILGILGTQCILTGFVGHQDRALYEESLIPRHVQCELFDVPGHTRDNFTIVDPQKSIETHIRDVGFEITEPDLNRLNKKLGILAGPDAVVIFTGSLPRGISGDDFKALIRRCQDKGSRVAIDSSGDGLSAIRKLDGITLIKPNCEELSQITEQNTQSQADMLRAARSLLDRIDLVVVTAGPSGACLVTADGAWQATPHDLQKPVLNSVGCGDALLAGFVHRYAAGVPPQEALRYSVATGTAASFQVRCGEVEVADVDDCYKQVSLETVHSD